MRDWDEVARAVRENIRRVPAAVKAFMRQELPIFTGEIQEKFYTTGGEGLSVRSGRARRGWDWDAGYPRSIIFNTLPYADHSVARTIRGKNGKKLAIPIGKALTASRVPRFSGPRDPNLPELTLIVRPGKAPLLADVKNPKRIDLYFVLLPSVKIPARTQGLRPWASQRAEALVDRLGDKLVKELGT